MRVKRLFKIPPNQKQLTKPPEKSTDTENNEVEVIPATLTKQGYEDLANDILIETNDYISNLQAEIEFINQQLKQIKYRLSRSTNAKVSLDLTKQYTMLLNALHSCTERKVIAYMASYMPLTRLLEYQEKSKKSVELEIEEKKLQHSEIEEDFDPSQYYKPYED